ncbi:MAG: DUF2062 domain-containing protein [Synechococcus sp.]
MARWIRQLQQRCQRVCTRIWRMEGSPGQRARGLAAGIFCGCFPFFGLQTLLGTALAHVVRGNHLLAAIGTWISNPLTYVPLYWFNYHVGHALLQGALEPADLTIDPANLWAQGWSVTSRLLLGSSVVGCAMALVCGGTAWWLFRWQSMRSTRNRV